MLPKKEAYPMQLSVEEYKLIKGLREAKIPPYRVSHTFAYYTDFIPGGCGLDEKQISKMIKLNGRLNKGPMYYQWIEKKRGDKRIVDPFDLPEDWKE